MLKVSWQTFALHNKWDSILPRLKFCQNKLSFLKGKFKVVFYLFGFFAFLVNWFSEILPVSSTLVNTVFQEILSNKAKKAFLSSLIDVETLWKTFLFMLVSSIVWLLFEEYSIWPSPHKSQHCKCNLVIYNKAANVVRNQIGNLRNYENCFYFIEKSIVGSWDIRTVVLLSPHSFFSHWPFLNLSEKLIEDKFWSSTCYYLSKLEL